MYTIFSVVHRQRRKSDVMTSFGLTACSAVYYHAGSSLGTLAQRLRLGQAGQRRCPSHATHVSHMDGVFYLLLHRHKIQGNTVYCPIRRT
jgi:hypothetical protein